MVPVFIIYARSSKYGKEFTEGQHGYPSFQVIRRGAMNCARGHRSSPQAGAMMHINKLIGASVGADLSRTPPIYRPSLDFPVS